MKWRKKLLLAAAVLTTTLCVLVWVVHVRGLRKWEEYCAQARAAGEPITVEDVIPDPVPDGDNVAMAEIFRELFEDKATARLTKKTLESIYRPSSDDELIAAPTGWLARGDDKYVREWLEFVKGAESESFQTETSTSEQPQSLSPGQELQRRLAKYNPMWDELNAAVRRPRCRWPLDYEEGSRMKSPHHTPILKLLPLLKARLTAHAACDDSAQYLQDLTTGLRLSRHLTDTQISLLSTLVASTMWNSVLATMQRTAGAVTFTDSELAMVQEHASVQAIRGYLQTATKEQALSTDVLLAMKVNELASFLEGDFGSMLSGESDRLKKLQATLILSRPSGWKLGELAVHHEGSRKLWAQSASHDFQYVLPGGFEAIRAHSRHMKKNRRWLSFDSILAIGDEVAPRMYERAMQVQAASNAAVLWCAVERYRLRHGRLPDSLEALAPEFVKKIPVDPVLGGPMQYVKKENGGYLIYSIGLNGVDDGGQGSGRSGDLDWVWASAPGLTAKD